MKAKVELHNIGMKYQSPNGEINALENINLTVYDREFVCIVGPSGCGKSTLLSIMSGLLPPTSGYLLLNGEKITGTSKKIGYMLQKDHLFGWRTILENVLLGLEIQSHHSGNQSRAAELLKTYGLYEFRNKYPNQLSGGMLKEPLLFALMTDPEILLLDEAFLPWIIKPGLQSRKIFTALSSRRIKPQSWSPMILQRLLVWRTG